MLPAVAQGALCLETRENDSLVEQLVRKIDHADTHTAVSAERAFLKRLEGGCQVPIAALARMHDGFIFMDGLVADVDGRSVFRGHVGGPAEKAVELGIELADNLLAEGAGAVLEKLIGGK